MMKGTMVFCALLFWAMQVPLCACAAPEAGEAKAMHTQDGEEISLQELKGGLQEAVGGMVGIMGAIMGGLSSGLQEGANDAQAQLDGADGVTLVRNAEELTDNVSISVLSVERQSDNGWRVLLAFRNRHDFPVRLTNLTNKQNVLLQDTEGFVYEQAAGENAQRMISVPAQAALKVPFDFVQVDARPRAIRLYGKDIPFPDGV